MKVYLAGPILHATADERDNWRFEAQAYLEALGHTVYLPLEMIDFCSGMGLQPDGNTLEQIITIRDMWFSTRSDVVLANFGPGGESKASIGTSIELGWASAAGVKIVGILPEGNIHNHPIVDALLDIKVFDLETALKVLEALGEGWTKVPPFARGGEFHY